VLYGVDLVCFLYKACNITCFIYPLFAVCKSPYTWVVLPPSAVLNLYVNILLNSWLGAQNPLARKNERQNQEAGKFKASNS